MKWLCRSPGFGPRAKLYTVMPSQCYTPRKRGFLFCPFEEPSSRKNATNEISFESPNTELSEFIKKLGVASSRGRHCPIN